MHGYKLTRRGKLTLTTLVVLVFLAGTLGIRNIAIASDQSEYTFNHSSKISAALEYDLDLRKSAAKYYDEMIRLEEEASKKEQISVKVEDIKTHEGKLAFLTFDDGPSKTVTPEVLNVLEYYQVKATFFVLGNMCDKNGDLLKEIHDKGHRIGIHSYSHKLGELLKSEECFANEIEMTENALKRYLGDDYSTRLFRFPGGSFEKHKRQYMGKLTELGYVSVDWNALTGDTEYLNPTPEMLLERLKSTASDKGNIVVLMHDSETKQISANVLPDVIEYLRSEGYEFAILE